MRRKQIGRRAGDCLDAKRLRTLDPVDEESALVMRTLDVDGEVLCVDNMLSSVQRCFCVLCGSFDGGVMMRVDCSNCTALTYFCKSHEREESFASIGHKCMQCRAGGVRYSIDRGITQIMRCLHVECTREECPERVAAADMEKHLREFCSFNLVKCPLLGCHVR
jgi:hypothetical protein